MSYIDANANTFMNKCKILHMCKMCKILHMLSP